MESFMKFTNVFALSIALLTVAGAQAGWLDGLTGASTASAPAQTQASGGWMDQLGGMFGQQPASTPAQLGQPPIAAPSNQATAIAGIQQNISAIIAKVREMTPAITAAVTNKDFTSAAALAAPAKDLLTLGMSTAKNIQQVVAANPQAKGVIVGLVNQLSPMIAPVAAQIRTLAASAGFGTSFVLKTIATGLEQIPQLLNQATQ
jgi:hypothetical protein